MPRPRTAGTTDAPAPGLRGAPSPRLAPTRAATHQTIVALGSPPGRSLRGLIRLSGPETDGIVQGLLAPDAALPSPRQTSPATLRLPRADPVATHRAAASTGADDAAWAEPSIALPCMLTRLVAPRSYTGQSMAEIQMPGHPALLERVLREIFRLGARPAEPGEFTFRAWVHGKLDLTRAEGVAATIAATSDAQLRAAGMLRRGRLGEQARAWVDRLANLLALVEAGIDFVDQDDVTPIAPAALLAGLRPLTEELEATLASSATWASLESLPRVVLAGPPSVGKSTLFNALLGRHRALVAPAPGTTRDVLEEPLTLRDPRGVTQEVMLVDLAGLDAPASALDAQAQEAARNAIASADLVLAIDDGRATASTTASSESAGMTASQGPRADLLAQMLAPGGRVARPMLAVRTKADLGSPSSSPSDAPATSPPSEPGLWAVSARLGTGVEALRQAIAAHVGSRGVSLAAQTLALQPRHREEIAAAAADLRETIAAIEPRADARGLDRPEMLAAAMRRALDHLAGLGGDIAPDDVIGRIFASFCVGK